MGLSFSEVDWTVLEGIERFLSEILRRVRSRSSTALGSRIVFFIFLSSVVSLGVVVAVAAVLFFFAGSIFFYISFYRLDPLSIIKVRLLLRRSITRLLL